MINFLINVTLGIFIGWYLIPFKNPSTFRNGVNKLVVQIVTGIVNFLRDGKSKKRQSARRTNTETKQKYINDETADTIVSVKSNGKKCEQCGGNVTPAENLKGFGICDLCQHPQLIK